MGGYVAKRIMFLQLLTPILLLPLLISSSSGEAVNSSENRVCVSKGGRSHHQPYELEGKLSEPADLEFQDLNMCNMFHERTCCSASRMLSASLAIQNLASHGEASKDCLFWFELLECSICRPDVGVQPRPLRICASFCDTVFEACSDAYFSSDAINQVTVPCGARNGTICEKAYNLETNGTDQNTNVILMFLHLKKLNQPLTDSSPVAERETETIIHSPPLHHTLYSAWSQTAHLSSSRQHLMSFHVIQLVQLEQCRKGMEKITACSLQLISALETAYIILEELLDSVLDKPYDCSAEAELLHALIVKAQFENNRSRKPKKKQLESSSKHVDWL